MLYSAFFGEVELLRAISMQLARESFFSAISAHVPVKGYTRKTAAMQSDNKNLKTKIPELTV